MNIKIGEINVEVKYWESLDGKQKRYYLKAAGRGHNAATWNVNTGKWEFPKNQYLAMSIEFANKVKAAAGF